MELEALSEEEIRNAPRALIVYNTLKRAIRNGQIRPGDRLRETEVAERLGVSRTPVREALHRLITEGLLKDAPGRGVVVTELDKQQVLELYALREVLEGSAAAMAAQRAYESDIMGLWAVVEKEKDYFDNPERLSELNAQFHRLLNEAAHNRYLTSVVNGLADTLGLLKGTSLGISGRAASAHKEHVSLVSAIEQRDAELAESIAKKHIREARRARMQMLSEHD